MTNIITKKAIVSVFLTDLHAYNCGELRGEWVALPTTREELDAAFERVTCGQDHETFVTDYESEFGVKVDEFENLYTLNEKLSEIDPDDFDVIAAYLEAVSDNINEAIENADRCTLYSECETLEDLAYELIEEGDFGEIPESVRNYIDYEAIARDLGLEGYYETTYGVLYHG